MMRVNILWGKSIQVAEVILWCIVGIIVFSNYVSLYPKYYLLTLTYWLANLIIIFLPNQIRHSLPVIIIGGSGFVRYIMIPFVMARENIVVETIWCYVLMETELLVVYGTIYFFTYYYRNTLYRCLLPNHNTRWQPVSIGLSTTILLFCGCFYTLLNNNVLFDYIVLSGNRWKQGFQTGYESIFMTNFFLVIYCLLLELIRRCIPNKKFISVLCMICISIFFINGRAVQSDNVSRWAFIVSALVCFIYISSIYPKYKKGLLLLFFMTIVFAVTVGTMAKVAKAGGAGFQSLYASLETQLSFRYLNAYFSGPLNLNYVYSMLYEREINDTPRLSMFFSDIFANFPLLNKFFSNITEQSTVLFNYQIYKSNIACDQIIPISGQFYLYAGALFWIPIGAIIWCSLICYFKMKEENNKLKLFCLVYITFSFSLINCVSFSVMLQNIWIHVLPAFFIYKFNIRLRNRKDNKGALKKVI